MRSPVARLHLRGRVYRARRARATADEGAERDGGPDPRVSLRSARPGGRGVATSPRRGHEDGSLPPARHQRPHAAPLAPAGDLRRVSPHRRRVSAPVLPRAIRPPYASSAADGHQRSLAINGRTTHRRRRRVGRVVREAALPSAVGLLRRLRVPPSGRARRPSLPNGGYAEQHREDAAHRPLAHVAVRGPTAAAAGWGGEGGSGGRRARDDGRHRDGHRLDTRPGGAGRGRQAHWPSELRPAPGQDTRPAHQGQYDVNNSQYDVNNNQYDVNNSQYDVNNSQYNVNNSQYDVNNSQYDVNNSQYDVNNSQYDVNNSQYNVNNSQYDVNNSQYDVNNSQYNLNNSQYDVNNSQYNVNNSQYDVNNSQYDVNNSQYDVNNSQYDVNNSQYDVNNSQYDVNNSTGTRHSNWKT